MEEKIINLLNEILKTEVRVMSKDDLEEMIENWQEVIEEVQEDHFKKIVLELFNYSLILSAYHMTKAIKEKDKFEFVCACSYSYEKKAFLEANWHKLDKIIEILNEYLKTLENSENEEENNE